jgi:lysophospholipase L1-like esterase
MPAGAYLAGVAPRCVLFFGDSLVAGVGDPAGGGWVARVVSACFDEDLDVTAYNLGVRGETSVQVANRWRAEATARMLPGGDARLVVSFGTNDTTLEHSIVRVPAARSLAALARMLEEARTLGFAPLVVGPAPIDDSEQNQRIADLSASFAELCHEHDTPFFRVFEPLLASSVWMSEVSAGDGAHPGAAGYQTLARLLIEQGLLTWLSTEQARPSSPH